MEYEKKAFEEMRRWQRKMMKRQSMAGRFAKKVQKKMNSYIPDKVHAFVSSSIKNMVHATLIGSEYTTQKVPAETNSLQECELMVKNAIIKYKRTAAAEGAGTGAGGILLGMADFPLLLGIKMKFLFDVASIYGFDVKDYRERLYILHLFQLAFSSEEKRHEVFSIVSDWEKYVKQLPEKEVYLEQIDWKSFQLEYRDHIDLVKMLQLVPGFGAIVGAAANYHFLDVLGETAMNGYRMRIKQRQELSR
ncbi:EcsC family protein [Desertibacillus haloalkaliphilus]|uniref:EcsC family protein n=1 Tax=Desertibacillus haloalkaliphilus TaxID=1328930 RepID=UPI001C26B84A|nr:EcsC family protein [Desertibacillus haloalkaliphilus]MBU8905463.1 EcsC family protein [Desertibacillus haloalkaliphilus]